MIRRSIFTGYLAAASIFHLIAGHSWIACTDYSKKNAAMYDHDLCRGYPRNGKNKTPKGGPFGKDVGFAHTPAETNPCQAMRNDRTMYDEQHPIAVYYPGQQVVLAHPMKNHGSDRCTNRNIPDNGNFLYRGEKDATSDPTLSEFKKNLVADLGKKLDGDITKYPKPGYQNAPAFCDDTDKSLGTYSFNVPRDLEPGRYTFIWLWAFNKGGRLYSTCFEVDIVKNLEKRNIALLANGIFNNYEPCGGMTSHHLITGNSNPGCTEDTTGSPSTLPSTLATRRPQTMTMSSFTTDERRGIAVSVDQMAGKIILPGNDGATRRRIVEVSWWCSPTVTYWNANVQDKEMFGDGSVRQRVVQEGNQISIPQIYFTVSFPDRCGLRLAPEATLVKVE